MSSYDPLVINCCLQFKQMIDSKIIVTKQEAIPEYNRLKDPTFYNIHPNFVMWVDDMHPIQKHGWHWYHYCPNCGAKKDSDENIKAWAEYWKKTNKENEERLSSNNST